MARSVAALTYGTDYQYRFFWIQACRLFDDRPKAVAVEIETDNIKSLDDVAVHYKGMFDGRDPISSDYYQVKFHVTANGAFTFESMIDPLFISATSVSLLKRIHNAQLKLAPDGHGCRFYIYSPWSPHPDDALSELVSLTDGHIRWENLAEGGERSAMGRIRSAWRKHLDLPSDEDLRVVLMPLRLSKGPTLVELGDTLNDKLQLAGLKSVSENVMIHPYENLAEKLIQTGRRKLSRDEIETICKNEGLWIGRTVLEPDALRIGIRSFLRFAEHLEDETDDMLCLLRHFDGRFIHHPSDWDNQVVPEVRDFLGRSVNPGGRYLLHLPAHGSIAFLAGWCLNTKSGANVALVQTGIHGREIWRPINAGSSASDWQVRSVSAHGTGNDLALAISATHDIEADTLHYVMKCLPSVSRIICCRLPIPSNSSISDSTHASFLARRITGILKDERTDEERSGKLHLFFAAPNSLVFFMGQLSTSFGPLTLYEYDLDKNVKGAYSPSINLPPSNMTSVAVPNPRQ